MIVYHKVSWSASTVSADESASPVFRRPSRRRISISFLCRLFIARPERKSWQKTEEGGREKGVAVDALSWINDRDNGLYSPYGSRGRCINSTARIM